MEDSDINEKIVTALKDVGFNAAKVNQLTSGSYNKVFAVDLDNGKKIIVRIFRSRSWPENGKLEWISSQLTESHIPTAKILFSTREDKHFSKGFMVQEFVDGEIIEKVVGKEFNYSDYYTQLGLLMKQVHKIQLPKFGYIGNGTGNHISLLDFVDKDIDIYFDGIKTIQDKVGIDIKIFKQIVSEGLEPFSHLPPVLNHNDLSPNNVMLDNNGELVLIDWDGAVSNIWINDFTVMTYWMKFIHEETTESEEYIKLFLNSYKPDISNKEIRKVEKVLHFVQALSLLGYYYFDDNNMKSFNDTLIYFNELKQELLNN